MSRKRGLGVLFGLAALVVLTLVAWFSPSSGISLGPVDGWIAGIPGIEDDLREKTETRLTALGARDAEVTVDGRDVTVALPSGFPSTLDPADLSAELLRTKGVRTVSFDAAATEVAAPTIKPVPIAEPTAVPEPTPTPEPQAPAAPNEIIARVDLGSILLSGDLQTEAQRSVILDEINAVPGTAVVDQMRILDAASTAESDQHARVAGGAVATLARELASGSVRLNDDVLTIDALVAGEGVAEVLTTSLEQAASSAGMQSSVQITAASPPEPAAEEVVASLDLSGVNFESGTAELRSDAFATLDEAAAALAGVTDVLIEVQGHTDGEGDANLNQALSEARAAVVAEYLVANGVDPALLTAKGYGEAEPIDDNGTEQGRAANRRVELVVIEGN